MSEEVQIYPEISHCSAFNFKIELSPLQIKSIKFKECLICKCQDPGGVCEFLGISKPGFAFQEKILAGVWNRVYHVLDNRVEEDSMCKTEEEFSHLIKTFSRKQQGFYREEKRFFFLKLHLRVGLSVLPTTF